jgi:hemerythrin
MVFIKWKKEWNFGFKEIDEQHKQLVEYVNKVHEISGNEKELDDLLNALVGFVRVHFETEEKYMKKFNCEGQEEHIKIHGEIIQKILEFKSRFEKREKNVLKELSEFLKKWFDEHCNDYDRKYVECFKLNGLK